MTRHLDTPTIIITLDYEIFGDGSGDVRRLIIEPTEKLLSILAARKIRMTVFLELEELLVFRKYASEITKACGYNPALLIEKQLETIIGEGHEIGLHLHPQWIGARFDGSGFNLSPKNLRLTDVHGDREDLTSFLKSRLSTLKDLVGKYDPTSEVNCFRAGGFALRPEALVLDVLHTLGIRADSSVISGLYRASKTARLDYRAAPFKSGFWAVNDDVCREEASGRILEFPVYSQMKPEFHKLKVNRIRQKFFAAGRTTKSISRGVSEMSLPKTPWGMMSHLFKKSPLKFDYCHMTANEMLSFVRDAEAANSKNKYPLTMIGHSKEFSNHKPFASFIDAILANDRYRFRTMGETVAVIKESERASIKM